MENFSSEKSENCTVYSRVFQKGRDIIECSRDFILPDLYADIKKVISSSGSIYPEECFVEGNKVCVSGTLTARILFADDEGALRSVTFTQDYSGAFSLSGIENADEISVICSPVLESVSVKTVNPRKVSVRGRIDAGVKLWKKTPSSPDSPTLECECDVTPEIRTSEISCMVPFSIEQRDLDISEDISFDGEIDEIIYCNGSAKVHESSFSDGSVHVRGYVNIYAVCLLDSSDIVHISKMIPFSNSLTIDSSMGEPSVLCALPYIRSLECETSETDDSKIEIDIEYALIVNGAFNVGCSYVCDAYMPSYEFEIESETVGFSSAPQKSMKNIKVNACSDSALPEGSKVMLANVQAQIESTTHEEDKKSAIGSSFVNIVYKNTDGTLSSLGLSEDFEIDLDDISDFDEYVFLIQTSPASVKNDQNGVCAEYELEVNIIAWKNGSGEMIRASRVISPETADNKKPFTIYYPSKDESLWDVGKKYNVTVSSIVAANPECEDAEILPNVILIPRLRTGVKK